MNFSQPLLPLRAPFIRIWVNSSFLLYTLERRWFFSSSSFFVAQDAVNLWLQFPGAGGAKLEECFSGAHCSLASIVKAKIKGGEAWCSYWRMTPHHLVCPAVAPEVWNLVIGKASSIHQNTRSGATHNTTPRSSYFKINMHVIKNTRAKHLKEKHWWALTTNRKMYTNPKN